MKQPPKVCIKCEKLRVSAVYMDGSCEYACLCPQCEYREAYKEAEREERSRTRRKKQTMSDDLIKRKYAMYALCNGCEKFKQCNTDNENWCDKGWIIRKGIPSEDRPQGEWIDKGWKGDWQFETDGRGSCWRVFECSVCNGWNTRKTHFCPHCGARMKGADDESTL